MSISEIESVDLSLQNLVELPDLTPYGRFRHLTLSFNKIRFIPESFKDLDHLEELDLRLNEIDVFPVPVLRIVGIRRLDLRTLSCALDWLSN